jgi:hypothetical protein
MYVGGIFNTDNLSNCFLKNYFTSLTGIRLEISGTSIRVIVQ